MKKDEWHKKPKEANDLESEKGQRCKKWKRTKDLKKKIKKAKDLKVKKAKDLKSGKGWMI